MKRQLLAIALAALAGSAAAQSPGYTPTAAEVKQSRENTLRDARMADAMAKERMKEEAKPVAAYIPKEQKQPEFKEHKPEVFIAGVPGAKKKPSKAKKQPT